jgi:hypothetical protein
MFDVLFLLALTIIKPGWRRTSISLSFGCRTLWTYLGTRRYELDGCYRWSERKNVRYVQMYYGDRSPSQGQCPPPEIMWTSLGSHLVEGQLQS